MWRSSRVSALRREPRSHEAAEPPSPSSANETSSAMKPMVPGLNSPIRRSALPYSGRRCGKRVKYNWLPGYSSMQPPFTWQRGCGPAACALRPLESRVVRRAHCVRKLLRCSDA